MYRQILMLALSLATANSAFAKEIKDLTLKDLTADQQKQVQAGKMVTLQREVPNAPWPEVIIFLRVDATAEETAAVFNDFNYAKNYNPDLKESKISKWVGPRTAQIDYVLDLPFPLGEEKYTLEDTISTYNAGLAYRTDWKMIKSTMTKSSVGHIRIEMLDAAHALAAYYNFVVPGSDMAGSLKERALQEVQATVNRMADQVELELKSDRALLDSQVATFRKILTR